MQGLPVESLNPFDFRPRTRVVFGNGSLDRIGALTKELGGTRVLMVSDPGIAEAGHPARAARLIEAAGCAWKLFTGLVGFVLMEAPMAIVRSYAQ